MGWRMKFKEEWESFSPFYKNFYQVYGLYFLQIKKKSFLYPFLIAQKNPLHLQINPSILPKMPSREHFSIWLILACWKHRWVHRKRLFSAAIVYFYTIEICSCRPHNRSRRNTWLGKRQFRGEVCRKVCRFGALLEVHRGSFEGKWSVLQIISRCFQN